MAVIGSRALTLVACFVAYEARAASKDDPDEVASGGAPAAPPLGSGQAVDVPSTAPGAASPPASSEAEATRQPSSPDAGARPGADSSLPSNETPPASKPGSKPRAVGVRDERFRVAIDLSASTLVVLATGMGGNGLAMGGLGSLAGVTGEVHLAGPAWLVLGLQGSFWSQDDELDSVDLWSAGIVAGSRLEAPVLPHVDVGGHLLFRGGMSGMSWASGSGTDGTSFEVGAIAGAAVHVRPSDFFGIRIGLDLLEAGYGETHQNGDRAEGYAPTDHASVYARLNARPWVGFTFTF